MADIDPGLASSSESAPADPLPVADEESQDTGLASLREEVTALVEDARNYADAEIAFQKTRAAIAAKRGVRALVLLVLALVLLNLALVALAVGAVIALAPYVTIWGAIAIVVGVLLAGVGLLVASAAHDGRVLAALFGSGDAA
jgi:uncharacterized membrane protein YqjE